MPTYDYQCRSCGSVTEVIHSMLEDGPSVCDRCGGTLRRVLFPAGIIFKGSGFYRTDSRSGGSTIPSGSASPDGSRGSEGSNASDAASTKPAAADTGTTKSTEPSSS